MNHRLFLLLLLTFSLSAACGDDLALQPGAFELQWTTGPAASCTDAGIRDVEVQLTQKGEVQERFTFDCQMGSAYVPEVKPGRYDVVVMGMNAVGLRTFEGNIGNVRINENEKVHIGTVRLAARPATVELEWFFDNGRLCNQNNVDLIEVAVFDAEYYYISSSQFSCSEGLGQIEPLPAGSYVLEVLGYGGADTLRSRAVVPIEVDRGESLLIEVPLGVVE